MKVLQDAVTRVRMIAHFSGRTDALDGSSAEAVHSMHNPPASRADEWLGCSDVSTAGASAVSGMPASQLTA